MGTCKSFKVSALIAGLSALAACGGGGEPPAPTPGFGVLSGKTVLVLPVQYVRQVPGGWIAGAANMQAAARQADGEITFALQELGGRATWITPEMQLRRLEREPWAEVNPYILSADEARRKKGELRKYRDPLFGEIRTMAALFDARYAIWPLEIYYQPGEEGEAGSLAVSTFLLDTRAGEVLWWGVIPGTGEDSPASTGALAALAQAFAAQASP
jgi:hypothetical protein